MAQTFTLDLITPEKTFFTGQARYVSIPGAEGEFGVLEGHMPFISTLKAGVIRIEQEGGVEHRVAVIDGVAEVTPHHCVILAETAQALDGISAGDAETALRHAQEHLAAAVTDEQTAKAVRELALARAVAMGF
jgi:F-type H+-transporting ATPase subunit epsilon